MKKKHQRLQIKQKPKHTHAVLVATFNNKKNNPVVSNTTSRSGNIYTLFTSAVTFLGTIQSALAMPEELFVHRFSIVGPGNESTEFELEVNPAFSSFFDSVWSGLKNNVCGVYQNAIDGKKWISNLHDSWDNCRETDGHIYGELYQESKNPSRDKQQCIISLIDKALSGVMNNSSDAVLPSYSPGKNDNTNINIIIILSVMFGVSVFLAAAAYSYYRRHSLSNAQKLSVINVDPSEDPAAEDFICPITHEIMDDPVVADDGRSYERKALETWKKTNNTCPMNRNLPITQMLPNTNLKILINKYVEEKKAAAEVKTNAWFPRFSRK